MKLAAVTLALLPAMGIASSWTSQGFPPFTAGGTGKFVSQTALTKGTRPLLLNFDQQCWQPADAVKLNQMLSLKPCEGAPPQWRLFKDGSYTLEIDTRSGTPTLMITIQNEAEPAARVIRQCPKWDGSPLTLEVAQTFPEGAVVRDFYSQQTATVKEGRITLQPAPDSNGLLLLERAETNAPAPFDWHNATVYFVLTDRFVNGDPTNDHSYGRHKDGMEEIGTFHGGDLRGLTSKLDYLQQLGVNALWISAPFEQIHGWVGGGAKGDFPHYAYHGYYTQDWTRLDANMGNEEDLRALVDGAHQRGIRVLFDVVMNHTGYATLADMQEFNFGALYLTGDELKKTLGERWTDWKPGAGQNWHSFNDYINFSDKAAWEKWWGKAWIRTDIGDYDSPGFDDLTMSLAFLPDLKTESTVPSGLPVFYQNKADTRAKAIDGYTPRDYLTHWLSQWVRDYGIDGFRVDTAKHVELPAWQQLKTQASAALVEWKKANPDKAPDDKPFWMTGEAWGHGVMQSDYYRHGFDAMINFDYQEQAAKAVDCLANIDPVWQQMAEKLQNFNVLSYLSSHDTRLFREGNDNAAELLLLAPGAVQIFYGDESARPFGPTGSDPLQGTRSDMNWQDISGKFAGNVAHWQRLGQFRARHPAIGAGKQTTLTLSQGYGFVRTTGDDSVMVVWAGQR
ncbi:alpha-amylase [Citrobacter rodentium]|uniref:Alpha-amylase n=2 Tax=Citrobacter rodentium TaxID=67825 RepID=D2TJT7_CITRI|nr:alpha-amylase [Citrobacter rodentium]KIQ51649.1 alpha-amylase [Citrobacter rodentium]QBY30521.1 alpha-amylase [Citrobacter rodentium]UHO32108.1 alpha-amylase [Citrobacter rodentium NBRC 105723 = DSM 16636]CBG90935.1 alpha-amylase [Citrobacter rodentium ICC168]HAT8013079.1 alpha-amylase [Citrobacter rodentium NBRC 105723 = DSM 16636]